MIAHAIAAGVIVALVLASSVALMTRALSMQAATRYALWLIVSAGTAIAPLAAVGASFAHVRTAAPIIVHIPAQAETPHRRERSSPSTHAPFVATPAPHDSLRAAMPRLTMRALLAIWGAGTSIGFLALVVSLVRVQGLKRRSLPLDGAFVDALPWVAASGDREVYLRLSAEIETPVAVGFRRPAILIPLDLASANGLADIESLVVHEHAHLLRRDDWTNLAQRVIERTFWWNPVVWIAGNRLALEREIAADDAVVARTGDAPGYAAALWRLAREMRLPMHAAVAPGALATRKQISVRIEELVAGERTRRRAPAAAFAVAALAFAGAGVAAAGAPAIELGVPTVVIVDDRNTPLTIKPRVHIHNRPVATLPHVKPVAAHPVPTVPPMAALVSAPALPDSSPESRMLKAQLDEAKRAMKRAEARLAKNTMLAVSERSSLDRAVRAAKVDAAASLPHVAPQGSRANGTGSISLCDDCSYAGQDLRGRNLRGLTFINTNFAGADLRGADLSGAHLIAAALDGADLRGTQLAGVELVATSLHGVSLDGVDVRSLLAMCEGCNLTGMKLRSRDLHGIRLTGTNLSGSDLHGANLQNVELRGVQFVGVDLSGADFRGARLSGVNFSNADLRGALLDRAQLTGCDLSGARLGNVSANVRLIATTLTS